MLNKFGDIIQPCLTPFITLNHSVSVPAALLLALMFSIKVKPIIAYYIAC